MGNHQQFARLRHLLGSLRGWRRRRTARERHQSLFRFFTFNWIGISKHSQIVQILSRFSASGSRPHKGESAHSEISRCQERANGVSNAVASIGNVLFGLLDSLFDVFNFGSLGFNGSLYFQSIPAAEGHHYLSYASRVGDCDTTKDAQKAETEGQRLQSVEGQQNAGLKASQGNNTDTDVSGKHDGPPRTTPEIIAITIMWVASLVFIWAIMALATRAGK